MAKRVVLTTARRRAYELDARTLNFYRRNPVIAAEDLLGIYLADSQAWVLQSSWNTRTAIWSCSRNWGKSFIIAIYAILRAILYPNQNIYIISSVGNQAKETFSKIEEICLRTGRTAESIPDLKDIIMHETESNSKNPSGFKHDPSGYEVKFHSGSRIVTLNSKPDNVRGKRANLIIYDEASFVALDLVVSTVPFVSQSSDSRYGKDAAKDKDTLTRQPYNQIIMASSQNDVDCYFYKEFKNVAKKMIAGDKTVFCADMPCTTSLKMYMKGQEVPPLLKQSVVDDALKADPEKARREYFNKPDLTGGTNQIIKWNILRNNERQIIPYSDCRGKKIILGFDPARTVDNSIMTAMEIEEDPELGICGNIVGCVNFVDLASSKKYKLDSNRQVDEIRNIIIGYNGDNPDYEYLDSLQIDAGAGGGGLLYTDNLLNDFVDIYGNKHRGLIDASHELYSTYKSRYPNAVDKLRLISPRKYRTQMVEEFIELMELGVIRFPYQYNGQEFLKILKGINSETGDEIMETYNLSQDEIVALNQIDLMKTEICSIHKTVNAEKTSVNYALAKEKQNSMHDDRFFTILLCSHRLYELRRGKTIKDNRRKRDVSQLVQFRAPKIL